MEYSGRTTLSDMLMDQDISRLSDADWLKILLAMASRLDELHRAGYVHTDFKPSNVIITLDPQHGHDAHIIDFGISVRSGELSRIYNNMRWKKDIAKMPWFAAETLKGTPVSPATDVVGYSQVVRKVLGVMRKDRYRFLNTLVKTGMALDPAARPSLDDFAAVIYLELSKISLAGKIEGKRPRGRPRQKYMDGIVKATGGRMTATQLLQLTYKKDEWRATVANVPDDTALR